MGCESSKAEKVPQMKFTTPSEPNFGRKAGLDPKDFIFTGKNNQTLIKSPSQIGGQQFILEECEGSDIFLLDHVGSLTVDYCKNCRIVTGPVSSRCKYQFRNIFCILICSSVFIRNCQNCVVVIACQQLRLRDCSNLSK